MWDPSRALFHCTICGAGFATGEVTDAMGQRALLFDTAVRPHLGGLSGPDRLEAAKRFVGGALNRERLEEALAADPSPKGPSPSRPIVQEAHERVQRWIWEEVAERGTLRAASTRPCACSASSRMPGERRTSPSMHAKRSRTSGRSSTLPSAPRHATSTAAAVTKSRGK